MFQLVRIGHSCVIVDTVAGGAGHPLLAIGDRALVLLAT